MEAQRPPGAGATCISGDRKAGLARRAGIRLMGRRHETRGPKSRKPLENREHSKADQSRASVSLIPLGHAHLGFVLGCFRLRMGARTQTGTSLVRGPAICDPPSVYPCSWLWLGGQGLGSEGPGSGPRWSHDIHNSFGDFGELPPDGTALSVCPLGPPKVVIHPLGLWVPFAGPSPSVSPARWGDRVTRQKGRQRR